MPRYALRSHRPLRPSLTPHLPLLPPPPPLQFLTLAAPVQGVTVRLSAPFDLAGGRAEPGNALAVSNHFGWAVAATQGSGEPLSSTHGSCRACTAVET
mgnify:CR=1 FL=1